MQLWGESATIQRVLNVSAVIQQVRCTGLQHARRRPWRYLLSLASIAVAVALFVSMRITQVSVLETFRANMDALAGGATLTIAKQGGLKLDDLAQVERVPGVKAAPVVQHAAVLTEQRQTVTVLGIDAKRDAALRNYKATDAAQIDIAAMLLNSDTLVVTQSLAQRYGWELRSRVKLTGAGAPQEFVIAGILKHDGPAAAMGGNIVFMPLPTAQRFFRIDDRISLIDVALTPPATAESLASALGPKFSVGSARGSDPTFDALFVIFKVILVCITGLSGMIGVFIVYNSMALSVVQRAKEIGTLRALGARRSEVLAAILVEAAALGLIAAGVGLVGGIVLAKFALGAAGNSLAIIVDLGPPRLTVPGNIFWLAPLVGMVAAALGALAPARTAAAQPPVLAMKPGEVEAQMHARTLIWFLIGAGLLTGGLLVVNNPLTPWFVKVTGVVASFVAVGMLGPQLVKWIAAPVRRIGLATLNLPGILALDSAVKFPTRTSLTLVALGGSLSVVVSMTGMIGSLDRGVQSWLDEVLVFDLSVNGKEQSGSPYATAGDYPPELLDEIAADPRMELVYGVRARMVELGRETVMLFSFDAEAIEQLRAKRGRTEEWLPRAALEAGEVGVSENLATIRGLRVGDTIDMPTPSGPRAFRICGIRPDYTWFRGTVLMDRKVYAAIWNDPRLSYVDMKVKNEADIEACRADWTARLTPRFPAVIYRPSETKEFAVRILHDWFALANVQLLLAVFIGGVGVANCLLISLISQSRQIGLLRAIGAAPAQIRNMLLTEAAFLGIAGGVLGSVLGLGTMQFIIKPLAIRASGFVLPFVIPTDTMAYAAITGLGIALIAALLPLQAARRIDVVQAIGYE